MIARHCEFADYNSSNSCILQLEFLNRLFKLYLYLIHLYLFNSISRFRHLLRRNRQGIKYAVDFVNTGSTNLPTHAELLTQWSYPIYRLQRQPTPKKWLRVTERNFSEFGLFLSVSLVLYGKIKLCALSSTFFISGVIFSISLRLDFVE